ncbi:MAG: hypothetical protein WC717_04875 [Candidatus Micrarchaeia archaeon]|jgi:hypothetical protein
MESIGTRYRVHRLQKLRDSFLSSDAKHAEQSKARLKALIGRYCARHALSDGGRKAGKAQEIIDAGTVKTGLAQDQARALDSLREEIAKEFAPLVEEGMKAEKKRGEAVSGLKFLAFFASSMAICFFSEKSKSPIIRGFFYDIFETANLEIIFSVAFFAFGGLKTRLKPYFRDAKAYFGPIFAFAAFSYAELMQKLGNLPGTFDKLDFVAAAIGAVLGFFALKPFYESGMLRASGGKETAGAPPAKP